MDKFRTRPRPASGFFFKTHTRPYNLSDRVKSGLLGSSRTGYPRVGFKLPSLATTASASPIKPQIAPSESNLSDLPFCEISSSSDPPRASTCHYNSRRYWHAPTRAVTRLHALPRARTQSADIIISATSALATSASTHLLTSVPRHHVTSSADR